MNEDDITSLATFISIWFQPIFWMYFFYLKTTKLDRIAKIMAPTGVVVLSGAYFILQALYPGSTIKYYPNITLYVVYGIVGLCFMFYLVAFHEWHFPQAMSISAIVIFLASFYWQTPFIIRNVFRLGFELDWLLHIIGFMFVWYIKNTSGWKPYRQSLPIVGIGFVVAMLFMIGYPVGNAAADVWNSPYFLADRVICTVIAFIAINKVAPKWRVK